MIANKMKKEILYGLVGYPLGHSFSQNLFRGFLQREGVKGDYINFELKDLSELAEKVLSHSKLRGFNVTIPYKETIIPQLDYVSDRARIIGAVNVVRFESDGSLFGYNTDWYGFVETLKPLLCEKKGIKALVLGTGGASKAVKYGLEFMGIEVQRVSRARNRGDIRYEDLTEDMVKTSQVIVNTTPLGMHPNVEDCPDIPYDGIGENHICYDLVYNPSETLFMRKSADHGAMVLNGLGMLYKQAELGKMLMDGIPSELG